MITRFTEKIFNNPIQTLNQDYSSGKLKTTITVIIFAGLSLLFLSLGTYLIWKKFRHIREPNETESAVNRKFEETYHKDSNIDDETLSDNSTIDDEENERSEQETLLDSQVLKLEDPDLMEPTSPSLEETSSEASLIRSKQQSVPEKDATQPEEPPAQIHEKHPAEVEKPLTEALMHAPYHGQQIVNADMRFIEQLTEEWLSVENIRIAKKQLETVHSKEIDLGARGTFVIRFDKQSSTFSVVPVNNQQRANSELRLEMSLDSNDRISRWVANGTILESPHSSVPINMQEIMKACLQKVYVSSFHYYVDTLKDTYIEMTVFTKVIKLFPEFHLKKLTDMIVDKWSECRVRLKVTFFSDQTLDLEETDDEGGPSRNFIDDMLRALFSSPKLRFTNINNEPLLLPKASLASQLHLPVPHLNRDEQQLYEGLGTLMMYCHQCSFDSNESRYLLTGHRFNEALFSAILSLSALDIDASFEDLSDLVKLRMSHALIEAFNQNGMGLDYLSRWIRLALNSTLTHDELENAVQYLLLADSLPEQFTKQVGDENEPDFEMIEQNMGEFIVHFRNAIYLYQGSHGRLGEYLAPLHALAKGMKKVCNRRGFEQGYYWDANIRRKSYLELSKSIQGTLDRDTVADQLVIADDWITGQTEDERQEKLRWLHLQLKWLKKWIIDDANGATESELRNLLKYMTGFSSLQENQQIFITAQEANVCPFPKVNTCALTMYFAPQECRYGNDFDNSNKENFIKGLRSILAQEEFGFQLK